MVLIKYLQLLFVTCFIWKNTTAVSEHGHELLKSLKEYYLFQPIQYTKAERTHSKSPVSTILSEDEGKHMTETTVSFTANGTTYNIVLELNTDLIPSGFSASYLGAGKNGEDIFEEHNSKEINNCYYHGHVIGIQHSQVVASTCNGLKGTIFLPDDVLQFSPIDEQNFMHVLYRPHDSPQHSCGTKHFKSFHRTMTVSEAILSPIRMKRATEEKKFIELMFVVDSQSYKKFGSDRKKIHDHIKEVLNYIDAMYKKLQLRVVLLHVEVWATGDKITSDSNAQNVLSAFLNYRREKIQNSPATSPWRYTDNAQLLYGGSFDGSTVGMATVSSMCSLRSGGVNEIRTDAHSTASTVAHEMGHNMGMSHDTSRCRCDGKKCVMAATAGSTPPDAWSDCSVNYLKKGYEYGTDNCIFNFPDSSKLFGGPKCGNGIVEKGENCDCGLPDECQSKCCNATTCQLHPEAECADGACCTSDCHFKSSCSVCRPTENDCDITEYCTGHSAHCPGNVRKLDGLDCRSGSGICYGGICRTHEMQCQEIWGPGAGNGDKQCYDVINKKGDSNGNCGRVGGTFIPCTPENILCGKILCTGGERYPLVASDRMFFKNTIGANNYVCKSLSSINGTSDSGEPGAVWDGTKCGDGKMCFDGVCSNVSQILKRCNMDCHGHGVCNNFGNCHCDAGWAHPDCLRKGHGGSADSGPICAETTELQVVLLLVFFLVILPIILGVMFFVWWRVMGGKAKVYAWRMNRAYRKGQQNPSKVNEARKENGGGLSQPNSGIPTENRKKFNDFQPSVPNTSGPTRPPPPVGNQKRRSAPNVFSIARPPPPFRPSPRLPQRQAPPTPTKPPMKPSQVPQRPTPPNVEFRKGPTPNGSNNSNPTSIQARIAQLKSNKNAV